MRLARILIGAWLFLGGITACSDHNPTVFFAADAGADGKAEAGASQDGGGNHDGGTVEVASDGGGSAVEVRLAVDLTPELTPEANPGIDVPSLADTALDRPPGSDQAVEGPAPTDSNRSGIDSSGPALDGPAGTALEVGIDSSADLDSSGTGG